MRILVVEDDKQLVTFLKSGLEAECFAVDAAEDGEKGEYLALTNEYDLIILDYNLPKQDGEAVCAKLRQEGKTVPIMILSVRSETENKINLLNSGADDYLTKPFSFNELLARVRALLRRPKNLEEEVLKVDDITLDVRSCRVYRGNKEIYLTRKEFALLEYLMKNKDKVMSREVLFEHIWDANTDPFSNTIESHILNLRKKVERKNRKKLIITVPGRGYKIDR